MKNSRELVVVLILVVVFIGLSLAFAGRGVEQNSRLASDDLSSYGAPDTAYNNSRASGSLAAFTITRKLGYRPVVWRHPWNGLSGSGSATLIVVNPAFDSNLNPLSGGATSTTGGTTTVSPADWPILKSWISSGNTAIILTSDLANNSQQSGAAPTFGDAAGLLVDTATPSGKRNFSPSLPGPYTEGVVSLYSDSDARVRQMTPDGIALFTDPAGALALCKPVGSGRLIVVADALVFSNASLGHSDNAVLFANLLSRTTKPGGIVLFDEYHHGDAADENGDNMWSVLGRPIQLAIIQGCVALIALLIVLGNRFGKPISLSQGQTRHSGEYVTSLAALHRRAGATTIALETIYRNFLRDLCARLGISADTRLDILARTAAKRTNVSESALRNLLVLCEQRLDEGRLPEAELLELVRQMEQIRKDVGIA